MIVSDWVKKITDILMPIEENEEEEYAEAKKAEAKAAESKAQQAEIKEVKRVAAGGGSYAKISTAENGFVSVGGKRYVAYETPAPSTGDNSEDQPNLKLNARLATSKNFFTPCNATKKVSAAKLIGCSWTDSAL